MTTYAKSAAAAAAKRAIRTKNSNRNSGGYGGAFAAALRLPAPLSARMGKGADFRALSYLRRKCAYKLVKNILRRFFEPETLMTVATLGRRRLNIRGRRGDGLFRLGELLKDWRPTAPQIDKSACRHPPRTMLRKADREGSGGFGQSRESRAWRRLTAKLSKRPNSPSALTGRRFGAAGPGDIVYRVGEPLSPVRVRSQSLRGSRRLRDALVCSRFRQNRRLSFCPSGFCTSIPAVVARLR